MAGSCDPELRQSKRIPDVAYKKITLSASDGAEDHGDDIVGSSRAPIDDQALGSDNSVEDPYSWLYD